MGRSHRVARGRRLRSFADQVTGKFVSRDEVGSAEGISQPTCINFLTDFVETLLLDE